MFFYAFYLHSVFLFAEPIPYDPFLNAEPGKIVRVTPDYWKGKLHWPGEVLKVVVLDVWQGDAIFIRTPDDYRVLIDGGQNASPFSSFDAGYDVVIPYLEVIEKINSIDTLVMTHPHNDHVGGLLAVLKHIKVKEVLDPGMDYPSGTYDQFLALIEEHNITYRIVRDGEVLHWGKKVRVITFGPVRIYHGTNSDPNNNSIVLKLIYKRISFLFTGDCEEASEIDMVNKYGENLRSFFLKAPHHGSATSIVDEFLDAVSPRYAFISVGKHNKFGHPSPRTIEKYMKRGIEVYRTDLQGTIVILTDGVHYSVETKYTKWLRKYSMNPYRKK